jgi:hypothetical protein
MRYSRPSSVRRSLRVVLGLLSAPAVSFLVFGPHLISTLVRRIGFSNSSLESVGAVSAMCLITFIVGEAWLGYRTRRHVHQKNVTRATCSANTVHT